MFNITFKTLIKIVTIIVNTKQTATITISTALSIFATASVGGDSCPNFTFLVAQPVGEVKFAKRKV